MTRVFMHNTSAVQRGTKRTQNRRNSYFWVKDPFFSDITLLVLPWWKRFADEVIKSSFIQRKLFSFSKSSALGLVTRVLNPISQICWEGSSSSRLTVEFGEGEDVQQRWWRFTNEELKREWKFQAFSWSWSPIWRRFSRNQVSRWCLPKTAKSEVWQLINYWQVTMATSI